MYSEPNIKHAGKALSDRYTRAKSRASNWREQYENVRELVRPNVTEFMGSSGRGRARSGKIYDSTAPWALEQLASGLHSYMTDPTGRWFSLGLRGIPITETPVEVRTWLEAATDRIYAEFQNPVSRMQQTIKEVYLDLASFGTGVQFENWDPRKRAVVFRSFPLASVYLEEGYDGAVNTVFRDMLMKLSDIREEFPRAVIPENMLKAGPEAEWTVTHAVFPNFSFVEGYRANLTKRFASVHFIESEKGVILSEGGFDRFPYQVPRWTTLSGEVYGRGPALTALPDIQLLNVMWKELIVATQLANRPPIVLDDDGFMLPIVYQPSALIFKTPGTEMPQALQTGGNFTVTLDMIQQKREQVSKAFHVDWLLRGKKKERQSVYEVSDDRQEMLRQLASTTGRIETDHLSPMIHNVYFLLEREGELPPPPEELNGMQLQIVYTSSAAKAQMSGKADIISRFLAEITPLAAVDSSIFDGLKGMAEIGQELALLRDVSPRVLDTADGIARKRQQRESAAQAQTGLVQAQQAGAMAGALKDVATAGEKGLMLG